MPRPTITLTGSTQPPHSRLWWRTVGAEGTGTRESRTSRAGRGVAGGEVAVRPSGSKNGCSRDFVAVGHPGRDRAGRQVDEARR